MRGPVSKALGTADAGVFLAAHCVGHHSLHDPRHEQEPVDELRVRHLMALDMCQGCPCTTPCSALLNTLPRTSRGGVWAGRSGDLPTLTVHGMTPGAA